MKTVFDQRYQQNPNYTVRGMSFCTSTVSLFYFFFFICPFQKQGGSSVAMPFEPLNRTFLEGWIKFYKTYVR